MKLSTIALVGVLCSLLVVGAVTAQDVLDLGLSLNWHRMGGGGQKLQANNLSLYSTIGQSLAGSLQGGGLEMRTGFMFGLETPPYALNVVEDYTMVEQGQTAQYDLVLSSQSGYDDQFGFSVIGAPSGTTVTFNPNTLTGSGTTSLRIQTTQSTPAALYQLTVVASDNEWEVTQEITLVVAEQIWAQDLPLIFRTN